MQALLPSAVFDSQLGGYNIVDEQKGRRHSNVTVLLTTRRCLC